jgi:hypothetical protein
MSFPKQISNDLEFSNECHRKHTTPCLLIKGRSTNVLVSGISRRRKPFPEYRAIALGICARVFVRDACGDGCIGTAFPGQE